MTVEAALVFSCFFADGDGFCVSAGDDPAEDGGGKEPDGQWKAAGRDCGVRGYSRKYRIFRSGYTIWKTGAEGYLDGRAATAILQDGVGGISTLGSSWEEDTGLITLQASCQAVFPPGITWFHPIRIMQKRVVRGWIGFDGREESGDSEKEEVVYVTDYGSVYHKDLSAAI